MQAPSRVVIDAHIKNIITYKELKRMKSDMISGQTKTTSSLRNEKKILSIANGM